MKRKKRHNTLLYRYVYHEGRKRSNHEDSQGCSGRVVPKAQELRGERRDSYPCTGVRGIPVHYQEFPESIWLVSSSHKG